YRLAGLTHLHRVRHPAGVDDCSAGARRAAKGVSKLLHEVEVLGAAQATTPRYDDPGILQLHLVGGLFQTLDDACAPGAFSDRGRDFYNPSLLAALADLERLGSNQYDGRPGVCSI